MSQDLNQYFESLIFDNYGLIKKAVNKFRYCATTTFDIDDIHSTAMIGFIRAAQMYRDDIGYKFSTYAYAAMSFQIIQAIETVSKPLRVSRPMQRIQYLIQNTTDYLYNIFKRTPTIEEVSQYSGVGFEKVKFILSIPRSVISFEKNIAYDTEYDLHDVISDNNDYEQIAQKIYREDILNYLNSSLNENEFLVLEYYYGFSNIGYELSFSEIANMLNIKEYKVKQIHSEALSILRNEFHIKYISDLLS